MSVSLFEMLENFSYNTSLGDEADHPELASAAVTKERVDFVADRFRWPQETISRGGPYLGHPIFCSLKAIP